MHIRNTSMKVIVPRPNAFQATMLTMEAIPGMPIDSFSAACLEEFRDRDSSQPEYRIAQVFEPSVLEEVALLGGVSPSEVASLEYAPSSQLQRLKAEVEDSDLMSPGEALNLSSVLISISRFALAHRVLDSVEPKITNADDKFLYTILRFIVENRSAEGSGSATHFAKMRSVAEKDEVAPSLLLDGCTQAVVWYLKRREVHEADLEWFVRQGLKVVSGNTTSLSRQAVSSWYRGIAMLPAKIGDAEKTRAFMDRAREVADDTLRVSKKAHDVHLRKTYYESTMKEYMYVRPDFDMAEQTGRELIELDPLWGPSWAELGEVYAHFGRKADAAAAFDSAIRLGAPWVRYAMRAAGDMYREMGDLNMALSRYYALTLFPDVDAKVLTVARELATEVRPDILGELSQLHTVKVRFARDVERDR